MDDDDDDERFLRPTNDEDTDSTDVRFEFEVRQEAMQLQRIQAEINAMLVQARLYSGVTNSADLARVIQIERTLQSLRNEQTLVENHHQNFLTFGTGFPDASTVSAASGAIPLGASSSSSAPPGATSGVGLFGAAQPVGGIDWNWRPSWMATDSTTDPIEEVD